MTVALVASLTSTARADYWWGNQDCNPRAETPCAADNLEHTFCWGGNFDNNNLRDAGSYAMTNLANQTAFRRNHVRNCGDKTDVVFRKTSDPRLRGLYDCLSEDGVVGPGCQKAIVYMNPANLSDDRNRDKTACHEVGHSGGLSHSSDASDCMISGPVSQGHRDYNNHHVNHLNNNAAKIGLD